MSTEPVKAQLAADVLLIQEGKVLLSFIQKADKWGLPGGRLEGDERFEDAAIRELREELGIDTQQEDLKLSHIFHNVGHRGEMVACMYTCESW